MLEIVLRIIGILITGLIEGLFHTTGRRLLSSVGIKSNIFVESLVGILCVVVIFIALIGLGAGLLTAMRAAQSH